MDMLFDKFPNEIYPFDFETYFASEMECELVVTNCITGDDEDLPCIEQYAACGTDCKCRRNPVYGRRPC